MNYADWLDRFEKLVAALKAKEGFNVQLDIAPGASEEELTLAEAQIAMRAGIEAFRIPEPLRKFYAVTGGFDFQWTWRNPPSPHKTLVGMFNMATLGELFDPLEEEDQYIAEDLGEGFSLYGQFRTFDNLGPAVHVLAKFADGQDEPALFWREVSDEGVEERLSPLRLGFDEYLEKALAACCLFPWQELFVADARAMKGKERTKFFSRLDLLAPLGDRSRLETAKRKK